MANQYKFVGTDNSTSGSAINPFGTGNPLVSETYVIKSILVTSAGTPTVTVTNNSITAIKSAALTANVTTELTGEVYKDDSEWKAKNIPESDIRKDVRVIMPSLDLFGETK